MTRKTHTRVASHKSLLAHRIPCFAFPCPLHCVKPMGWTGVGGQREALPRIAPLLRRPAAAAQRSDEQLGQAPIILHSLCLVQKRKGEAWETAFLQRGEIPSSIGQLCRLVAPVGSADRNPVRKGAFAQTPRGWPTIRFSFVENLGKG